MVISRCWLPALLLAAAAIPVAAAPDRVVSDTAVSSDSDGQHQQSEYLGYVHPTPTLGKAASTSLRVGYWRLKNPDDRIEFGALRADHQRSLGPVDFRLSAKQLWSDDWSPTLGGIAADYHATPRWTLSGSGDVDVVDTVLAVRRHTRINTYNLTTDYQLLDTLTLIGGVLQQRVSDGNRRAGGIVRLVYSPSALAGFNAQLRLRRLDSDFRGVGYFSPDQLEEAMALLQYGHALPGGRFVLTGLAGSGVQRIDGTTTSSLYLAELRTRGWFTDHFGLEGKAGCSNTGGINVQAATGGYRYCYGTLSLIGAL